MDNDLWWIGKNPSNRGTKIVKKVKVDKHDFKVKQVSTFMSNTILFLDMNDTIWGIGLNLPSGDSDKIVNLHIKAKKVETGLYYSLYIDMDDDLYLFGEHIVTKEKIFRPVLLTGIKVKNMFLHNRNRYDFILYIIDLDNNVWRFEKDKFIKENIKATDISINEFYVLAMN
jgi:hypothetical protein